MMFENESKTILLTGANGFVGKSLANKLASEKKILLRLATRSMLRETSDPRISVLPPMDLTAETNWHDALEGCDVVIHTAARVHVMEETANDPLYEFRKINVEGTLNLARQAAQKHVKRFVFISSIKVNGESTSSNQLYAADDIAKPEDPYAFSKYEAEQGLLLLSEQTGMEVVIIRPPLVYGPGVKGNFQRMISWLQKGIPLPLGMVKNKRSFVALDNLVSLILTCVAHPKAANQIFLVSDGDDLSTPELLKKIGRSMNKPVTLLPIPFWFLKFSATILGKKDILQRLCGSLQVDITKTCNMLDWKPVVNTNEGLDLVIQDYLNRQ